eukprot:6172456-Amphidinium_carterae.1
MMSGLSPALPSVRQTAASSTDNWAGRIGTAERCAMGVLVHPLDWYATAHGCVKGRCRTKLTDG